MISKNEDSLVIFATTVDIQRLKASQAKLLRKQPDCGKLKQNNKKCL